MKRNHWFVLATLLCVVAVSGSAFAGEGKFTVLTESTLEGKLLRPGCYSASWNDDGEVLITPERGATFKVQGKVVERAEKAARTSILKKNDAAGEGRVLELRFSGKKTVLVFGEANAAPAE